MMKDIRDSGGFTLIEILVATTILLVIVIMASIVFQQSTGAYETGERKVGANVVLRNVVGAITRDLALAVDSDEYDGLPENNWGNGSIRFVALTGRPGYDADGNENANCRTPHVIEYSSNGARKDQATSCSMREGRARWARVGSSVTSSLYDSTSFAGSTFSVTFTPDFESGNNSTLPDRLYIRAELETEGESAAVGAGSGGRRGWGSPDEIWVGVRP